MAPEGGTKFCDTIVLESPARAATQGGRGGVALPPRGTGRGGAGGQAHRLPYLATVSGHPIVSHRGRGSGATSPTIPGKEGLSPGA